MSSRAVIKANRIKKIIFPNIAHWMNKNDITYVDIAKATDVTPPTAQGYLKGSMDVRLNFILAFLEFSGMTFEEAFAERRER